MSQRLIRNNDRPWANSTILPRKTISGTTNTQVFAPNQATRLYILNEGPDTIRISPALASVDSPWILEPGNALEIETTEAIFSSTETSTGQSTLKILAQTK